MKEIFIKSCEKIKASGGKCDDVNCDDCPFSVERQPPCSLSEIAANKEDPTLLKSAIKYLEENMCEDKVVLDGVEYDLNDYEIKDINYSACYPLVKYLLKRGKMVKTRSGFINKPNPEHPLKKPTKVVKSRGQIYLQLIHDGYVCDRDGSWFKFNCDRFNYIMFDYCGKEPSPHHTWLPHWLEEK